MENVENIEEMIDEKLELAREINKKLEELSDIAGARKTRQFVEKEMKFLNKVSLL
jgi:hypothetical protein